MVGGESAEADDEQPFAAPSAQAASAPRPEPPGLAKAPDLWNQTRNTISKSIDQLKTAIRAAFADQGADLLADVEQKMARLDVVSGRFDHRLSECLAKARATQEPGARKAELSNAKPILTDYIKYVKSEPLIAHIDSNPFGVRTNLKQTLAESLTHMARAVG